jgi:hypothetical protein
MDGERFDAVARLWAARGASRRRLLRGVAGAAVAGGLTAVGARAAPADASCCAKLHSQAVSFCRSQSPPIGRGECRVHAYACKPGTGTCAIIDIQCISNSGRCR